ncbi:MAG: class II aldolase/adducin family protein, partial [Burkholderiales bacterium]
MKSLWNDAEAAQFTGPLGPRVYSSRLLGREKSLVLHGGGNTSVKRREKDLFGAERDVLYVKGSGWDLESIEAAGFTPVDLRTCGDLRACRRSAIRRWSTSSTPTCSAPARPHRRWRRCCTPSCRMPTSTIR